MSTRQTTPARSPIRTHGPLLLPKIRSQDQDVAAPAVPPPRVAKRARTSPSPVGPNKAPFRPSHQRSNTSPAAISYPTVPVSLPSEKIPASLLCSPANFTREPSVIDIDVSSRQVSPCTSLENVTVEPCAFPSYQVAAYVPPARTSTSPPPQPRQPQTALPQPDNFLYPPQQPLQYAPRAASPLAAAAAAAPITPAALMPTTNLYAHLTAPNPAPSLVRTLSFPLRDPNTRHFWWDIRQVRPWNSFTASTILSFPGAAACLSVPVSTALLPPPPQVGQRHPETEQALHTIYAQHYLPRINAALAVCSTRPLRLSVPGYARKGAAMNQTLGMQTDCMFVATPADSTTAESAAMLFGGKPTARVVGLVKSFDRFNTGMRVEGNVKKVEYLRGLAHLHHAMREHGCRYGFILTEIELVVVRNSEERGAPWFGYLEVASVQLAKHASSENGQTPALPEDPSQVPLTACLALWGLLLLAGDEPMPEQAHWKAEIGAPAEGTRRKVAPMARDSWMPQPQLAEKREAKRSRGWVWPEDPISRREIGKRGVRYGGI